MKQYILRRVILMIPLVLGVTTATFALIHLIPGDPVELMMSNARQLTQEEIHRIREKLGLNDPLPIQYVRYVTNLLKGDMGISVRSRSDVSYEIMQRLPDTVILTVTSICLVLVLALPIGILSALKRGTWIDTAAMTFALFGVSIPAFWFGIMLMLIFGLYLDWLPTVGQGKTPIEFARSLILPSVTLSLILLGLVTRVARSSMLEVLSLDYVRTAKAKGLGREVGQFPPRFAECPHPDLNHRLGAVRRIARRRRCDRESLRLARHRPAGCRRYLRARLPGGHEYGTGIRLDGHCRQLGDRHSVYLH